MTTVITRLFPDRSKGSKAVEALHDEGFGQTALDLIPAGGDAREAMLTSRVPEDAIDAYSNQMSSDNALLVVRAPFGMAGRAQQTLKRFETIDVEMEEPDRYVGYQQPQDYHLSVIRDRKKFLTGTGVTQPGPVFTPYGIPILSARQGGRAKVGHSSITKKFGFPMLARHKSKNRTISDFRLFGRGILQPSRKNRVMRDNRTPFSSALGWPTISPSR